MTEWIFDWRDPTIIFLNTIILFVTFTILYRRNFGFVIVENLIVGTLVGSELGYALLSIQGKLPDIAGGDMMTILAFLFGLCYFTVFSRSLLPIYRVAIILVTATILGLSGPMNLNTVYASLKTYGSLRTGWDVLMLIFFICALSHYIFGRVFEKPLRIPRTIGIYLLYSYCGIQMGANFYRYFDNFIMQTYLATQGPAIIVPVIIGIAVLVDVLRRRSVAVTSTL
jgi:hypothetical protein